MIRIAAPLALLLLLSACSTAVEHRMALPNDVRGTGVSVGSVETAASPGISAEIPRKLEAAVREELNKRKVGAKPVNLKLSVSKFEIPSTGLRFAVGAFAGANKMDVGVQVIDDQGSAIGDFDVKRDANPGGYGAFYDQEGAMIKAAAEAIVKTLYNEQ